MKLHADSKHPDYHEIVHFVKEIRLDGTPLKNCVGFNLTCKPHIATVATMPIKSSDAVHIDTHEVRGTLEIDWNGGKLFEHLYNDWVRREEERNKPVEHHPV
jgi:hypothetical protein